MSVACVCVKMLAVAAFDLSLCFVCLFWLVALPPAQNDEATHRERRGAVAPGEAPERSSSRAPPCICEGDQAGGRGRSREVECVCV